MSFFAGNAQVRSGETEQSSQFRKPGGLGVHFNTRKNCSRTDSRLLRGDFETRGEGLAPKEVGEDLILIRKRRGGSLEGFSAIQVSLRKKDIKKNTCGGGGEGKREWLS